MDPRGTQTVFYCWLEAWICHDVEKMATFCDKIPVEDARALVAEPLDTDAIARAARKWEAAVFQMQLVKTYDGRAFERPEVQAHVPASGVGRRVELAAMRFFFARDDLQSMDAYYPFLTHPEDPAAWVHRDSSRIYPSGHLLPLLETSSWAKFWLVDANGWRQLTNCAIAAALYHQTHGQWPDAMERLVPDFLPRVPTDPLTQKPYKWKNVKEGIIVYTSADDKSFQEFTDTPDGWLNLKDGMLEGELFLGRPFKQLSASGYVDPNNPCAGERR
jgi:hypothetical protein